MQSKIWMFICFLALASLSNAQDCSKLFADLKKGTLNGLSPLVTQEEVKRKLPCSTASDEDGSKQTCGGGVFFATHNFYFYTGDDYINIRRGFTGELSDAVFDKTEAELVKIFGKSMGDITDEEDKYIFFKTSYGCLCIKMADGKKADEIFIYAKSAELVDLCI